MSGTRKKAEPSEGGFLLAKAHQIAGRVFARLLKEEGDARINPAQGRILFALWRSGDMGISALSRATSLEPSTLTSMLDRLEAAGLVRRESSAEDRRALVVRCTGEGRAIERRYAALSERMEGLFYGGMTAAERTAFEASLRKVIGNLEAAERG
jgi:MarR family transcriptional regulator, organic hydroperoxide resistance regulator